MNQETSNRLLSIQERAMVDETYMELMREHEERNGRFLATMESLSEEQRAAIYDYLGVLVQMHHRMLELIV